MKPDWTASSRSPEETLALGRTLARAAGPDGGVVALEGPLGAGKTVFAKGVGWGLGIDPAEVASPSFVIASEYRGALRLVHLDLFRVESEAELEEAGLRDWLGGGTLVVVEWADRLPQALPPDRITVRVAAAGATNPTLRRLEVSSGGRHSRAWLARWREAWERERRGRREETEPWP